MSECVSFEPLSTEGLTAFTDVSDTIISLTTAEAVSIHLHNEPVLENRRDELEKKIRTGLEMVTRTLESVFTVGSEKILAKQLEWASVRLPHDGFTPENILQDLKIYRRVVQESVDSLYFNEISPYLDFMIDLQQKIVNGQERCF